MNKALINTGLLTQIRKVLTQARHQLQQTVNDAMVQCYWQIGQLLVNEEQQGRERVEYGKQQLQQVSEKLTVEFGKGFTVRNLRNMRAFYLAFPIRHAVRAELTWTHYRTLIRVENQQARDWYMLEAIEQLNIPHKHSKYGHITISIGVATCDYDADHTRIKSAKALLKLADKALYDAKAMGRNRVEHL